jgi:hypothetical protein
MKSNFYSILFCTLILGACSSGDKPEDAKQAREWMTGKAWAVKDVGLLESSFRENKGEPFIHTIHWMDAADSTKARFMKATLTLDVNPNPNDESGNLAHFDGLNLDEKQQYYFTSTQEESPNDRTVKLYVNMVDSGMQYPFTILQGTSNKVLLLAPREIGISNLVLSLER